MPHAGLLARLRSTSIAAEWRLLLSVRSVPVPVKKAGHGPAILIL
jgi:hypothetical protein